MKLKHLIAFAAPLLLISSFSTPIEAEALTIDSIGSKIEGDSSGEKSGWAVASNDDGSIVAIGSPRKNVDSRVGFDEAGRVRVYQNVDGSWVQLGSDIDGQEQYGNFGRFVDLSADGTILAVGAVKAYASDGDLTEPGLVRIYEWKNDAWTQIGADIDGEAADDRFGTSLSLSSDGSRVAIGAPNNDGNGSNSGHVRVFDWDGSSWGQTGSDIDGEAAGDLSGQSVSLSEDGTRLAIGAPDNAGDSGNNRGHVRVYEYDGSSWTQLGADLDGEANSDYFGGYPFYADNLYAVTGKAVSLNSDGSILAVGVMGDDTAADNAGTTKVFEYINGSWQRLGSNINGLEFLDESGQSVSLSSDGLKIAIGSPNGSDGTSKTGYVRLFEFDSETSDWAQVGNDVFGDATGDRFGLSLSLSGDGQSIVAGAPINGAGYVRVSTVSSPVTSSTPAPYSGPLVTSIDSNSAATNVSASDTVTVSGQRLSTVSKVVVGGLEGEVISTSADSFEMVVPEGLAPGNYDLEIQSSIGNLTYLGAFVITQSVSTSCANESMSYWTTRISDTQAKVYIKCPELDAKIRILHQTGGSGEYDVPFVKTVNSLDDPSLVVNEFGTYIVRTIELEEINRIRIRIDDEEAWKVRYNR